MRGEERVGEGRRGYDITEFMKGIIGEQNVGDKKKYKMLVEAA